MVVTTTNEKANASPSMTSASPDMCCLDEMIRLCLQHCDYEDATFLAELQFTQNKCDSSLHALADSYYRSGKVASAYSLLRRNSQQSPQTKYLLAMCCVDLNKLDEAERVLLDGVVDVSNDPRSISLESFSDSSMFARRLLSQIYCKTNRQELAKEVLKHSIKTNPLLWSSFERLCQIGDKNDFSAVSGSFKKSFKAADANSAANVTTTPAGGVLVPPQKGGALKNLLGMGSNDLQTPLPPMLGNTCDSFGSTPSPMISNAVATAAVPAAPPKAPRKQLVGARRGKLSLAPSGENSNPTSPPRLTRNSTRLQMLSNSNAATSTTTTGATSTNTAADVRRSARLFDTPHDVSGRLVSANSVRLTTPGVSAAANNAAAPRGVKATTRQTRLSELNNKENPRDNSTRACLLIEECYEDAEKKKRHPSSGMTTATTATTAVVKAKQLASVLGGADVDGVLLAKHRDKPGPGSAVLVDQKSAESDIVFDLLDGLSRARAALSLCDWDKTIEIIRSEIPYSIRISPIGLQMLAAAYFEATKYQTCCEIFEELRLRYDHYLGGLELYSTALWHLQKEKELSALAQQLTATHRNEPQTWCVAGNCFSLQKEHSTAIQFFQRAIQLEPSFSYANALLGHEYLALEQYDRSAAAFRSAVRLAPRHYSAWYGLGLIEVRRERLKLARLHLQRAVAVNARNSILLCQLSVVDAALGDPATALRHLDTALQLSPHDPICRYYRAQLLFSANRLDEALVQLDQLKLLVPAEPMVFFLAGKVYKKLDQTHLALTNFNWATELDPKGEPLIGDRRYDEEPVAELAAIDPTELEAIEGDLSSGTVGDY